MQTGLPLFPWLRSSTGYVFDPIAFTSASGGSDCHTLLFPGVPALGRPLPAHIESLRGYEMERRTLRCGRFDWDGTFQLPYHRIQLMPWAYTEPPSDCHSLKHTSSLTIYLILTRTKYSWYRTQIPIEGCSPPGASIGITSGAASPRPVEGGRASDRMGVC